MNNPGDQQNEARKQQQITETGWKRLKTSIDALTNEVKAYRAEHKDKDAEHNLWPKRTAKAAITYTIITAVIMLVSAYQTYLIRSNNVVSERAFISVSFKPGIVAYDTSLKQLTVTNILDAIQGGGGVGNLNIIAELTNGGNTATKNLTFFLKCVPSNEGMQEPWTVLYQGLTNPPKVPQFIGPHGSTQAACSFTGDQVRAISKGALSAYIMVDATYQDRLVNEWHRTEATVAISQLQFAATTLPTGSIGAGVNVALTSYGSHNCADEECPAN